MKHQDYSVVTEGDLLETCIGLVMGIIEVKACGAGSWYTHAISLLWLDFKGLGFCSPEGDWVQM